MEITATCQVTVKLDVTLTQEEAQAFKRAYGSEPGYAGMSNEDYVLATDVRNQLAQSIPDIGDTASPIPWWSNPALRTEYTKTPDGEEQ